MIESDRLLIAPYAASDIDELVPILADPITLRFWPEPFTAERTAEWVSRSMDAHRRLGFARYPVRLRGNGALIGDCGIMRTEADGEVVNDIGWIIHHPYWGRGYATEAARAVANHAFATLGLDVLHANMPFDHDASRHVAEKLGMRRVREFHNRRNRDIRTFLYVMDAPV